MNPPYCATSMSAAVNSGLDHNRFAHWLVPPNRKSSAQIHRESGAVPDE